MKMNFTKMFFSLLLVGTFAQFSFGQALRQGNFVIDPYYGWPNLGKSLVNASIGEGNTSTKSKGVGPWGLRMEYMAGDRFGITLDGIHNSAGTEYRDTPSFINDADGNLVENDQEYRYSAMMNRLRVQLGFNYHFDFSDPMLDAYFGVAAGTNNRFWSVSTTEPNSNFENESISGSLLPVSMRLRFGARYYFSDIMGVNFEIGLGGPVLSAGFSIKI